ncbi:hypothetical protein ABZV93_24985 [Actinopolymorpha sp. NPDC004070]|uniref:hypothetical protein n=1 Tax=Actinopolymorpha sp. NPDC004070 TaxID=3154548 RepID=UPI0033A00D59
MSLTDFGTRGAAFWLHATEQYDPERHEHELLTQVCRLLDLLDDLQARVDADGPVVTTSRDDIKTHPRSSSCGSQPRVRAAARTA